MEKIYLFSYCDRFLFIFLEFFSLLPLFLFAFKKRWFKSTFWKGFFIFKIINVIVHNYYEYGFYSNLLKIDLRITTISVAIAIIFILPAYIALFMYAFMQHKLFAAQE